MQRNPFVTGYYNGHPVQTVDVQGRLSAVERFDLQELCAALEVPGLQKTVAQRIRARIRTLERQAGGKQ